MLDLTFGQARQVTLPYNSPLQGPFDLTILHFLVHSPPYLCQMFDQRVAFVFFSGFSLYVTKLW